MVFLLKADLNIEIEVYVNTNITNHFKAYNGISLTM